MNISAAQVKVLREKTGVGMMECKKALVESSGDMEKAILWLRERGMSRAAKKADRVAAEGIVEIALSADHTRALVLEVNCETDFAAKNENFQAFVRQAAQIALDQKLESIEALKAAKTAEGATVEHTLMELIAKVGENMNLRRLQLMEVTDGFIARYIHMGGRIGVLVGLQGARSAAADLVGADLAMHAAAAAPRYFQAADVDNRELGQERELARKKLLEQGKPEAMVDKIVDGQMSKFYKEVCLIEQPFIKEPKQSVLEYVNSTKLGLKPVGFARFQLGEGIEVKVQNFAEEVALVSQQQA
jgi:elongation factor Ts